MKLNSRHTPLLITPLISYWPLADTLNINTAIFISANTEASDAIYTLRRH
jgi:hypothetical protein